MTNLSLVKALYKSYAKIKQTFLGGYKEKFKHFFLMFAWLFLAIGLDACADDEEVTLHLAALESAYGKEGWEQIIENYEALNENVTIDLTIAKNIEEVIRPEMQAGNYPDVFLLATDRDEALTETMIKENGL